MSRPEDFFALNEITARRLFLVGFRLFPATNILLHPRLTVLSGNNAVGKTTILDAVQTIFICHLGHINLNVASGHSDRNLSGQLAGQVAWACVQIAGHETVQGIGVRLRKKPGTDSVELSPFVLQDLAPSLSLFLNPDSGRITPDLQSLGQNALQAHMAAKVAPFDSVDAFHRYLHAEGLFPLDLSGSGKRLFSNLWRQVSQPRLDRLQRFLEEMLCPRTQTRKLGFDEVDRLIKDRRHIEKSLQRLEQFRDLRRELEDKISRLDRNRLAYLGLSLTLARQRVRTLQERLSQGQARESEVQSRLQSLESELAGLKSQLQATREQRDKYLGRQTDLATKYRHYQEYQQAQSRLPKLRAELDQGRNGLNELKESVQTERQNLERTAQSIAEMERNLAVGQEKEKKLVQDVREWESLQQVIRQCQPLFQASIKNKEAFLRIWEEFQAKWQAYRSLTSMKRELAGLEKRTKEHRAALDIYRDLLHYLPELEKDFGPERLQTSLQDWKQRMQALWEEKRNLQEQIQSANRDWEQLSKGRPPLPPGAASLVDAGLARPFAARFEHMDMEEAADWQARIGPFANALEPTSQGSVQDLAHHHDPFLLVTEQGDQAEQSWTILARSEHGVLSGGNGLAWYSPQGPVWLGAKARSRQMQALQRRVQELKERIQSVEQELEALQVMEAKASELLHTWSALEDRTAPEEHQKLAEQIRHLEEQGPTLQKKNALLSQLMQRTHAFDLHAAPEELQNLRQELTETQESLNRARTEHDTLSGQLDRLAQQEADQHKACEELGHEVSRLEARCADLRQEQPLEVLEGRVDFGREEELRERISGLERECSRLETALDELKETRGGLKHELAALAESLAATERELEKAHQEAEQAKQAFEAHYPEREVPAYTAPSESERQKAAAAWEQIRRELGSRLNQLSAQFDLSLPPEREPDRCIAYILESLLPPQVDLDNQEEKLQELRRELAEVEKQIRSYVEQIRKGVDQEIRRLDRRLHQVNRILESMSFGRIRRISLKREFKPAYEGLKNLRSTRLTLFQLGQEVSLQDFVQQIRETIQRYGRTSLDEDEILDYRSYIRLSWVIEDESGNQRHSGFSGGEGLGVNLAICLSLLYYFGQDQGLSQGQGVLIMALDEAERLDDTSLNTIRRLLEQVRCQLVVALPRTIHIPSSICHMLTPLPQGITHISVYHGQEQAAEESS